MSLKLYNTLTRRKDDFEPIEPGRVRMYCCGVTVYDYCHLGHARSYVVWDTLRRYLEWRGYAVRYVQNFTDIDDKILKRAQQEGVAMQVISDRYTATYFEDMARLNIRPADAYPRATHSLDGIQRLIADLEAGGHAYAAGGDVYFAVRRFAAYGKLSGRNLADLQAGASGRVGVPMAAGTSQTVASRSGAEVADHPVDQSTDRPTDRPAEPAVTISPEPEAEGEAKKQDPFDFALWKAAKPGEPFWESPWGPGRPGWHIECSAMVRSEFAPALSIDIHVGGGDLIFPHHENEIAQSEAATGQPLARYWLHNGMVNVGGEKMSKSLGNFTTIRALLDQPGGPDPMALRLFVLQGHYRKPMDFTDQSIGAAQNAWETLREGLTWAALAEGFPADRTNPPDPADPAIAQAYRDRFQAALDDDLNTPEALAVLFELAKELRKAKNEWLHTGQAPGDRDRLAQLGLVLGELAAVLGLEVRPGEATSEGAIDSADQASTGPTEAEIEAAIAARQAARQAKNFAEADRLRDDLKAKGVILVDRAGGETAWHRDS